MIIFGKRSDLSNVETFKYLLKKGANVHAGDDYALSWAAENGYLAVIQTLVNNGANVHAIIYKAIFTMASKS